MKLRNLTLSLLTLGGCSSAASSPQWSMPGPATGTTERPLVAVCDLGQAFLLEQFKLSCTIGFPPSVRNTHFWAERPCLSVTTKPDGTEISRTDLAALSDSTDAKALLEEELKQVFGNLAAPTINYRHGAGGRLEGLSVVTPGAAEVKYEYRYEGDRRVSEGQLAADGTYRPSYYYVYDDAGRLIREGFRGEDGAAPPAPADNIVADCQRASSCGSTCEEAFLCANEHTVPTSSDEQGVAAKVARASYYYDGDRLTSVVLATTPGLKFGRVDYQYEGDQLRSVSGGSPDTAEPSFALRRQTFTYRCGM